MVDWIKFIIVFLGIWIYFVYNIYRNGCYVWIWIGSGRNGLEVSMLFYSILKWFVNFISKLLSRYRFNLIFWLSYVV